MAASSPTACLSPPPSSCLRHGLTRKPNPRRNQALHLLLPRPLRHPALQDAVTARPPPRIPRPPVKKKSKRIENKKANAPPSIHPYNDHLQYPERAGGRDAKGTTSPLRDGERGLAPITCISRKRCGCQSLSQFCGKREARKASGGGIIGPWCQQGGLPCLVGWERERGNNGSHGSPGVRWSGHVCVWEIFVVLAGVISCMVAA